MLSPEIWDELYPDRGWPGMRAALREMAAEIRALRLQRSADEIQRAHDLVGQFCVETRDAVTFEHVSALCWVLRHDHNTAFAQILEEVESRLHRLGIEVVRLPELKIPGET